MRIGTLNVTEHGVDIGPLFVAWSRVSERVHRDTFLTLSVVRWGSRGRITGLSGSVARQGWIAAVMPPHPAWADPWANADETAGD